MATSFIYFLSYLSWEDNIPCNQSWASSSKKMLVKLTYLDKSYFWELRNQLHFIYKGHPESNASYFIMLAHDVRSRCWWHGSRVWTFPPVFHHMLLPCNRCHQRGSLTKQRLTWKYIWSKGVLFNSSIWKKKALMNIYWPLLSVYGNQTVEVSTVTQWVTCTAADF